MTSTDSQLRDRTGLELRDAAASIGMTRWDAFPTCGFCDQPRGFAFPEAGTPERAAGVVVWEDDCYCTGGVDPTYRPLDAVAEHYNRQSGPTRERFARAFGLPTEGADA